MQADVMGQHPSDQDAREDCGAGNKTGFNHKACISPKGSVAQGGSHSQRPLHN
jgi:hypothetical protein